MQAILDACEHLRDRFLLALLYGTAAFGLAKRWGSGMPTSPRPSARSRSCRASTTTGRGRSRAIADHPGQRRADPAVGRLPGTAEYGDLDSDYVFVNLFAEPARAGVDLSGGLRPGAAAARAAPGSTSIRTGSGTRWRPGPLRDGVPIEVVSKLLGPRLDHHHLVRLRAPHRRGRPQGAGGGGLVHRDRGEAVTSSRSPRRDAGLVAAARRRRARLRSWTPTRICRASAGRSARPGRSWLGHVNGLAPAAQVRAVFDSWRRRWCWRTTASTGAAAERRTCTPQPAATGSRSG